MLCLFTIIFRRMQMWCEKGKRIMNAINEELNLDKSDDESYNDRSNQSDEDQSFILSYFLQI